MSVENRQRQYFDRGLPELRRALSGDEVRSFECLSEDSKEYPNRLQRFVPQIMESYHSKKVMKAIW